MKPSVFDDSILTPFASVVNLLDSVPGMDARVKYMRIVDRAKARLYFKDARAPFISLEELTGGGYISTQFAKLFRFRG